MKVTKECIDVIGAYKRSDSVFIEQVRFRNGADIYYYCYPDKDFIDTVGITIAVFKVKPKQKQ